MTDNDPNLHENSLMLEIESSLFLEEMDQPGVESYNNMEMVSTMDFTHQSNIDYIEENSYLMSSKVRYASLNPTIELTQYKAIISQVVKEQETEQLQRFLEQEVSYPTLDNLSDSLCSDSSCHSLADDADEKELPTKELLFHEIYIGIIIKWGCLQGRFSSRPNVQNMKCKDTIEVTSGVPSEGNWSLPEVPWYKYDHPDSMQREISKKTLKRIGE